MFALLSENHPRDTGPSVESLGKAFSLFRVPQIETKDCECEILDIRVKKYWCPLFKQFRSNFFFSKKKVFTASIEGSKDPDEVL